jgi:hypothetical protein
MLPNDLEAAVHASPMVVSHFEDEQIFKEVTVIHGEHSVGSCEG